MNNKRRPIHNNANAGRMWAGIIIVSIGAVLLAGKLGFDWLFPHWIFSWHNMWPMVLIVVGLIIGGNSNFRNPASFILLGIGAFFFAKNISHFNIGPFLWPAIIIGIGLWLLLGRGRTGPHTSGPGGTKEFRKRTGDYEWDKRVVDEADPENYQKPDNESDGPASSGAAAFNETDNQDNYRGNFTSDDYIKSTAIFSDVKKTLISKNFKGGEIVNIFGGTDINLIQADIQHPIVIDVFQIFAGTKIIVPAHWKIQSDVISVFGDVDDRRFMQGVPQDEQKIVYIKGTSIFGGITIKNI
ncbi:cell wall-active antibiotics response protein [Parapedobacter tibetensis]|uniref:cell wall-active antibiotics response protein n=1 Tax=Parapedobacter tibetensis TaxID=2972951 RepID=UPI00214D9C6D|nr:cell wall-active antibiotics response protein [Parapedobacter tibetensis]